MISLLLPWILVACTSSDPTEDDGTIRWSGYILDGPYTGENGTLTGGAVTVDDTLGNTVAEGTEPYPEDDPGYWRLDVPPDTEVFVRLSADGMMPALFRGTTPSVASYWFTGALWAYLEEEWLDFFLQFDGQSGVSIEPLSEDVVWVFGGPYDAEDWVDARVTVVDGVGKQPTVLHWTVDDEGYLVEAGPGDTVEYFLAFNVTPGIVALDVVAGDGRTMQVDYAARGGEVVSAWYLVMPEAAP